MKHENLGVILQSGRCRKVYVWNWPKITRRKDRNSHCDCW